MSINLTIPRGFAGTITRSDASQIVEAAKVTATDTPTVYGNAVKIDANGIHPIVAADVTASVYGILVKPFPTAVALAAGSIQSVLRQGYMLVPTYGSATPAVNGVVYVRTIIGGASEPVGSFSTVADAANTFVLTNAHFTGGKDTDGNAELFIAVNA